LLHLALLPYGKQVLTPNSRLMDKVIVAVITTVFCSLFCSKTDREEPAVSAKGGGSQSRILDPLEEVGAHGFYPDSKPTAYWATDSCFSTYGK